MRMWKDGLVRLEVRLSGRKPIANSSRSPPFPSTLSLQRIYLDFCAWDPAESAKWLFVGLLAGQLRRLTATRGTGRRGPRVVLEDRHVTDFRMFNFHELMQWYSKTFSSFNRWPQARQHRPMIHSLKPTLIAVTFRSQASQGLKT